jgi:hypothetical protein
LQVAVAVVPVLQEVVALAELLILLHNRLALLLKL